MDQPPKSYQHSDITFTNIIQFALHRLGPREEHCLTTIFDNTSLQSGMHCFIKDFVHWNVFVWLLVHKRARSADAEAAKALRAEGSLPSRTGWARIPFERQFYVQRNAAPAPPPGGRYLSTIDTRLKCNNKINMS